MYLASTSGTWSMTSNPRNLLPFQRLVADRPADEQRVFLELQEGLLEAEALRSRTGSWPRPSELAEAGLPPFAPDPTRRERYDWRLIANGVTVNYLGAPQRPRAPAWLMLIQEPTPGMPPDQTVEDEEHHRLSDGSMLHVSTWINARGATAAQRIVRVPQAEGWVQLYAVGPSAPASGLH